MERGFKRIESSRFFYTFCQGLLPPCIWQTWVQMLCILNHRRVQTCIRIMPPYANGQATSHSYLNRNKQSIALDLKLSENVELIKSKISEYRHCPRTIPAWCDAAFRTGI